MGRSIPASSPSDSSYTSQHPMLTASFTALLVTASIAIVATLCTSCHRRPSPEEEEHAPSSPQSDGSMHEGAATPPPPTPPTDHHNHRQEENVVILDVNLHGPIRPASTTAPAERRRRLSMSTLSLKIPEGLARIRTARRERHGKAMMAVDDEDDDERIWKKTIILGEKCRVPIGEDENEQDGRRRNYHPRTPRSLPVSRTNSFVINQDHLSRAHHTPF